MNKSKKLKDEEIKEILQTFVTEYIAMHRRFIDFTQKYELWDNLPKDDQSFIESIALIIKEYEDKRNGNMGQ